MSAAEDLLAAMGIEVPEADREQLLAAYRGIAAEIAKLRALDLADEHPAVIFDPTGEMPR
jgi:hypothetical protein